MPSPTPPRPVADLSYEQARDELVSVVQRLEAGGETLEGSLELWERGEALAARCQEWLDGARERLETARTSRTGANRDRAAGDEPTDDPDDEDAR
ncbi:exodeoxyribonuclease VII small subunit [Actinotalea ferrariae]|uniref:exodeoxyribonuclease VII small subunit n=1 Tax=Actinotalea ferrariae TaxID=1386098 RepID=UPI001C8B19F5|nr:exodeoxyribonuclease VII small subunit [Actinotalea ferrariae]MBX9244181.1 exodeoxyribonuclease VII small subunit [Actinotalea ferrariae]